MRSNFAAALLASALTFAPTAAFADTSSPPSQSEPPFTASPLDDSIPSDLPRIARPLHYEITVRPDADLLWLGGSVRITMELYEPTDSLTLHANAITVGQAVLHGPGGGQTLLKLASSDPAKQTITLVPETLAAGTQIAPGTYLLDITYTGDISTQAVGLFALDYNDKRTGEYVRGLFTQFQAPDARRFAPMFDEPAYKATFDLTAIVPEADMAVSNMPVTSEDMLGDGTKRVTFGTSPKMSSYLLFFSTGDFERASMIAADGTDIGIIAPAGSGEQTRYPLEETAAMMPWFTEYFGVPYGLPKLDNVTGPGRSAFFAAMENWGAIFTFERYLLNDPANTSPAARQLISVILAHEIAHQWFGNIVTMAWWDDLWLNEGFASWMETKAIDDLHPEWFANMRRITVRERAMGLDAVASTHPVITPISTVAETAQAFDSITYAKGEAVIAMFEAAAGEDVFRAGLRQYFARHALGNTVSTDLWDAMESAGANGLRAIADDFTRQGGVPLVSAVSQCEAGQTLLTLDQSEFTLDRRGDPAFQPQNWRVPLKITVAGAAPVDHILQGDARLTLPGCGAVNINAGQVGYFRTDYTDAMLADHVAAFASYGPLDQMGLLSDALSMSGAGYKPFAYGTALLEAVPQDANPVLAQFAVGAWADAHEALAEELVAERAVVAQIAGDAWRPRLDALGLEPVAGEALADANLRSGLISAFGRMGDESMVSEALRRFAVLADDPRALDGPLKSTWLAIATRNAGAAEWQMLLDLAGKSTSPVEKELYYSRLGATDDDALARRALDFALSGTAGTFSAQIIEGVSARHPEMAFDFAIANYDAVRALVDESGWQGYVADLAQSSHDPAMIAKLRSFSADLPADEAAPFERVIGAIELTMARAGKGQTDIVAWLAER